MNPQFLLVLSPFLALLYVLFALIQALRGKRQGTFAALLAFAAAALSLTAYVLMGETPALRARLEGAMLLNAIIAFAASLLILLIERRRKDRDPNRSYGMIGIGLSILLALGTYVTPLLANAVPSTNPISTTTANNRADNTFQTISALTPGAVVNQDGPATTEAAPQGSSDLASVLSVQTGLSADDLTTQLTAGTSIAQLVSAHNGDLQAVTAAIRTTLDALVASGGRSAQLLTRLGTDTASVADQIVQGQLPAQAQERVIAMLTGTGGGLGGQGAFQSPEATRQVAPPTLEASASEATAESSSAATEVVPSGETVADVLAAQTGLSADDLNAQLSAGSTIAQLVSAHDGDLQAVTAAIKSALDTMAASGGREAGMLSRLGTDTATVAGQIVEGQLPAQQQQFVVSFLITGALPQLGGNGGGNFTPPNGDNSGAPANGNPPDNGSFTPPSSDSASAPVDPPQNPPTATPEPASALPPTSTIQRPTRIVFPTSTPTPDAAEATEQSIEAAVNTSACTLITNYNLNLRDKPTKDGSNVLLSIPMGTSVSADARTADGWYSVSYDGHDGWVSGEYASASADCTDLPAQ